MLISEHLDKVFALLSGPGAWCQGSASRDAEGKPAAMGSEEAVSHCLDGAVYEISLRKESLMHMNERMVEYKGTMDFLDVEVKAYTEVKDAANKKTSKNLIEFNDDATQTAEGVLAFVKVSADKARTLGK